MAYRVTLDGAGKGAKFDSIDEAKDTFWMLYQDKMSRDEFDKMIEDHIEEA